MVFILNPFQSSIHPATAHPMAVFRACSGFVIRCFKKVEQTADWLTGKAGPVFVTLCWILISLGGLCFCEWRTWQCDLTHPSRCRREGYESLDDSLVRSVLHYSPSKHVWTILPGHADPTRLPIFQSDANILFADGSNEREEMV